METKVPPVGMKRNEEVEGVWLGSEAPVYNPA